MIETYHNVPADWEETKLEIRKALETEYPDFSQREFITVNFVASMIGDDAASFPLMAQRSRQYRKLLISYYLRELGFVPRSRARGQVYTWMRQSKEAVPA
jgi:hypothetical protein